MEYAQARRARGARSARRRATSSAPSPSTRSPTSSDRSYRSPTSRDALAARIQQLQYGGGTDFKDALDIARRNLVESGRRVRHVILLTDGDTNRRADDHVDLIAALARDEITVTTIRIGSDTVNLELLDAISRATGGEFHHVEDVTALPQLMIRDTQRLIDAPRHRR